MKCESEDDEETVAFAVRVPRTTANNPPTTKYQDNDDFITAGEVVSKEEDGKDDNTPTETTDSFPSQTPKTSGTVVKSESLKSVVLKAAVLFFVCLSTGIIFWLVDGNELLPTISDTWTIPPASYISRLFIGIGCLLFQVANVSVFHANNQQAQQGSDTGKCCGTRNMNKFLLMSSVVAIAALSWVGAICDSTKDTCRGDNNVHLTFAYTFFICYNMYMIMEMCLARKRKAGNFGSPGAKRALWALVFFSVASKCRTFLPVPEAVNATTTESTETGEVVGEYTTLGVGNQTIVAIIEWTDVLCILVWTSLYVIKRTPGYRLSTVELWAAPGSSRRTFLKTATNDTVQVVDHISALALGITSVAVFGVLVVSTFFIEIFVTKDVPVPSALGGNASWPKMTALWVSPPGNWLARWSLVFAASLALSFNSLIHQMPSGGACKWYTTTCEWCGILGWIFVALMGVVDEYENRIANHLFRSFSLTCLLLWAQFLVGRGDQGKNVAGSIAVFAIMATRAISQNFLDRDDTLFIVTDWVATGTILLSIAVFIKWHKPDLKQHALAITYSK